MANITTDDHAVNSHSLFDALPQLLQLRLTINIENREWQYQARVAGAGKYLNHFKGRIPHSIIRCGEQRASNFALNLASRAALKRFKGAKIVCIEVNPEKVHAPIVRLEMGITLPRSGRVRGQQWAA